MHKEEMDLFSSYIWKDEKYFQLAWKVSIQVQMWSKCNAMKTKEKQMITVCWTVSREGWFSGTELKQTFLTRELWGWWNLIMFSVHSVSWNSQASYILDDKQPMKQPAAI